MVLLVAARVLAAHDSPPMAEMVKVVNKVSQNLHTEMLLRALGAQAKGEGLNYRFDAVVASREV